MAKLLFYLSYEFRQVTFIDVLLKCPYDLLPSAFPELKDYAQVLIICVAYFLKIGLFVYIALLNYILFLIFLNSISEHFHFFTLNILIWEYRLAWLKLLKFFGTVSVNLFLLRLYGTCVVYGCLFRKMHNSWNRSLRDRCSFFQNIFSIPQGFKGVLFKKGEGGGISVHMYFRIMYAVFLNCI